MSTTELNYIKDHGFDVKNVGEWFILHDPDYNADLIKSKNPKDLYDAVRGITQ